MRGRHNIKASTLIDPKKIKNQIYDLCRRRFQEQAVEPMQVFCNEINCRNTTEPRFLWFLLPAAPYLISGTFAGAGIVSGFFINKKQNDDTKKYMDERLKNFSLLINENQKLTVEKFSSSEEQLNILQAAVIAQVENQFLPQVVGEVFTTATQLVKEGIFHDRLLQYAPGAITQPEQYYLKKVQIVSCQELPMDQNLITINVTMILPVIDLQTSLFEHR